MCIKIPSLYFNSSSFPTFLVICWWWKDLRITHSICLWNWHLSLWIIHTFPSLTHTKQTSSTNRCSCYSCLPSLSTSAALSINSRSFDYFTFNFISSPSNFINYLIKSIIIIIYSGMFLFKLIDFGSIFPFTTNCGFSIVTLLGHQRNISINLFGLWHRSFIRSDISNGPRSITF